MCFNMVLPSTVSVDNIFGSIMKSKFSNKAVFSGTGALDRLSVAIGCRR